VGGGIVLFVVGWFVLGRGHFGQWGLGGYFRYA
jgi:hypothetical protein